MRGLLYQGVGAIEYRADLPRPCIEDPEDAIVRVTAAGLCGSDLHPYEGREQAGTGIIPGHEAVGSVAEIGAAVTRWVVGDRVVVPFTTSCGLCAACTRGLSARCARGSLFGFRDPAGASGLAGAQAGYMRVPLADGTLVELPPDLDDVQAVLLADNLPTAWVALERARPDPVSAVAVVGLGAVGLCAVHVASTRGLDVVGIDPVQDRRDVAVALGATALASGAQMGPFASVIESAGTRAAQEAAFGLLEPGGTLSVVSVQTDDRFGFTPVDVYNRNASVVAGRASVRSVLPDVLAEIRAGRLTIPQSVISHPSESLESGPALYRKFATRSEGLVKAVFST